MKLKIVNLRGTSGSGKSTVAHTMLRQYPYEELRNKSGKIQGYRVDLSSVGISAPLYILGPYTTVTGGCDNITRQQDAADMALKAWESGGHVFMEGLLVSGVYNGAMPKTLNPTGAIVYAILDTPIETCLARVRARREAKGNTKPLNEKNTRDKYYQTHQSAKQLAADGRDVRMIDHTRAFQDVLSIYQQAETEQ